MPLQTKFFAEEGKSVVGFFGDETFSSDKAKALKSAALTAQAAVVFSTAKIAAQHGVTKVPSLASFAKEKLVKSIPVPASVSAITTFVTAHTMPHGILYSGANISKIVHHPVKVHLLAFVRSPRGSKKVKVRANQFYRT